MARNYGIYVAISILLLVVLACPINKAAIQNFTCQTNDGYLAKTDADYHTAQEATTADSIDTSGNELLIGQIAGWTLNRAYFRADTSSLPDWAPVQKAWLTFYVTGVTVEPYALVARDTIGGAGPHVPLQLNDFYISDYNPSSLSIENSGTGWKNIIVYDKAFPTQGIHVSVSGLTKFMVLCSKDNLANPSAAGIVTLASADSSNKPYLTVQYNQPPDVPVLSGSATGYFQNYYTLRMSATDPDGDDVRFKINWGDGTEEFYPAPLLYVPSGEERSVNHKYGGSGSYTINVKTYDDSGETNDHSGSTVKDVSISSSPPGGGNPPQTTDTNEKFNRLAAKYIEKADGNRDLAIWWELSDAALLQKDLMVTVTVENQEGTHPLGIVYAYDHATEDTAIIIEDWNKKYPGDSTWSFTLHASFVNPAESSTNSKDDNQASLWFFIGMPIWFDFWTTVIIMSIIIIAIAIVAVYLLRKKD